MTIVTTPIERKDKREKYRGDIKKESVPGKRANPGRSLSLTSKDEANVLILFEITTKKSD